MAHLVEDMQQAAREAVTQMREAALRARSLHARAELMRHMRTTAAKVADRPRDEAVAFVTGEWMNAWQLSPAAYPEVAQEMKAFTAAFCAYAGQPDDAADAQVRAALDALDQALAGKGLDIADQMAWRSECAHGWWEAVRPTPAGLPGRKERPGIPRAAGDQPFWAAGAAGHCGAEF
jgi:hypothetical protein